MSLTPRPKPKIQHRKRVAAHHRQSHGYLKTYWPYLPMLAVAGLGVLVNSWLTPASSVLAYQSNFAENSLVSLTNQDRQSNGLSALNLNSELEQAAQTKANNLVAQNYWAHVSPSGQTPAQLLTASGYQFQAAGENLAYGFSNASAVEKAWMNSPDHRANVLDTSYSQVGFGVAEANNYLGRGPAVVVVAEYAEPAGAATNSYIPTVNQPSSEDVSRLQLLTNNYDAAGLLVIAALAGAAMATLVIRHGLRLQRLLHNGETYILTHPWMDIVFVLFCTVAVLLTRTVGFTG